MGSDTSEENGIEKKAKSFIGVHFLRYTNPSIRIALRFEGAVAEKVKYFQLDEIDFQLLLHYYVDLFIALNFRNEDPKV